VAYRCCLHARIRIHRGDYEQSEEPRSCRERIGVFGQGNRGTKQRRVERQMVLGSQLS
jgi:hypothetical protein